MTREQAYKKFKKIDSNIKWVDFNLGYMKLLDDIYDEFENRTCKSCKYSKVEDNVWKSMRCKCDNPSIMPYEDGAIYLNIYEDFCCNQYEPKENK